MFERFTDAARKSMAMANREAQRLEQTYIGSEHILLGIAAVQKGCGAAVLAQFNLSLERLRKLVQEHRPSRHAFADESKTPQPPLAKAIIEKAIAEANNHGDTSVSTGHLLLALLTDEKSILCQILSNLSIESRKVSEQILLLNKKELNKCKRFAILSELWSRFITGKAGQGDSGSAT
jgi:ATP-dependent Clp protease ATP-binding subunit ClpC